MVNLIQNITFKEIQRESRTLKFDLKLSDGCFLPKEYLPYPPDLTNVPVDDIDPVRRNQDQVGCQLFNLFAGSLC